MVWDGKLVEMDVAAWFLIGVAEWSNVCVELEGGVFVRFAVRVFCERLSVFVCVLLSF